MGVVFVWFLKGVLLEAFFEFFHDLTDRDFYRVNKGIKTF